MIKLLPETDLNDTIIDGYLKLISTYILPPESKSQTFIFSTFFVSKLLGDILQEDLFYVKDTDMVKSKVVKRVGELYPNIKRWTKRVDIFSLSYLAIPINSYKHWNCLIVVNPKALLTNPKECKIIFLDSMFEKRDHLFPVAIRRFLELELQERKQISLSL